MGVRFFRLHCFFHTPELAFNRSSFERGRRFLSQTSSPYRDRNLCSGAGDEEPAWQRMSNESVSKTAAFTLIETSLNQEAMHFGQTPLHERLTTISHMRTRVAIAYGFRREDDSVREMFKSFVCCRFRERLRLDDDILLVL